MTVKELIKRLEQYPKEMPVYYIDEQYGPQKIEGMYADELHIPTYNERTTIHDLVKVDAVVLR